MKEGALARISHQPPATDADPLAVPMRTPASHFDIVSTMPTASCSPCAPAQRRLDALATEPDEKSGLCTLHGLTTPSKHEQVHAAVQQQYKKTEDHLKLSGQPCGVKKGQDVVLDEA